MLAKSISGAAAAVQPAFVEDVFSAYLYTGNGSTQTITNGIDLAGKGGLVWTKSRSAAQGHVQVDTVRGANNVLQSNTTNSQINTPSITGFNSSGFSLSDNDTNQSGITYTSWTFRKQAKFFDVVTYTGTGSAQNIAHNLGSVPGCIIVKAYSGGLAGSQNWPVYHRSLLNTETLLLNTTDVKNSVPGYWNSTTPTSTQFTVGTANAVNQSGTLYVAYLFAHNAGGFGLTGTDNVISCGSFTTDGSGNATVTLGYEPQWMITKASSQAEGWYINDTMRGFFASPTGAVSGLAANSSAAEAGTRRQHITATGFTVEGGLSASQTYIYIAIRRGPMKVPTSGTSVFTPITKTADAATATLSEIGFPFDMVFNSATGGSYGGSPSYSNFISSRLTGLGTSSSPAMQTSATSLESSYSYTNWNGTTFSVGAGWGSTKWAWLFFRRAPKFFDVVAYTGTGSSTTFSHNLTVVPEMMIVKRRTGGSDGTAWWTYTADSGNTKYLKIHSSDAVVTSVDAWNNTTPTNAVFTVGNGSPVNSSGATYIAYLFASCPGVSKVGSYTGTGTTKQIDCGFTGGARFVMIKRTDSTGAWYVWDTARGIVSGNDPYLVFNDHAAEVTNTDYVDTYSAGFEISSTAPAAINANGGTFIFLAIA